MQNLDVSLTKQDPKAKKLRKGPEESWHMKLHKSALIIRKDNLNMSFTFKQQFRQES
jgi:hypothetical protein